MERAETFGHPEGCMCEHVAYVPKIAVYPDSSNMDELSACNSREVR